MCNWFHVYNITLSNVAEDVGAVSGGHIAYNGKSYWLSWLSDEQKLRNARWNWFTGRNYCRTMCMDMVSFETSAEQQFVTGWMDKQGLDNVHTAGRLCDAEVEGCNQTRFQPLKINGWFWASTLKMMPPTNAVSPNRFVSPCTRAISHKCLKCSMFWEPSSFCGWTFNNY